MKKLAFITHSHHKKTRSAHIYIDEMFNKTEYQVDCFYNESWRGDCEFAPRIEGYDLVVIVQLLSLELLNRIHCKNIIFMPMYDYSHSWDALKWLECMNIKVLSPSKTLHERVTRLGLRSHYIKYYPKPDDFMPGHLDAAFLWQRVQDININTGFKVLAHHPLRQFYLHRALDPGHQFIECEPSYQKNCQIHLSDWFEKREDYLRILEHCGIYIAPRRQEGGAAAFIDGMGRGKIVLSHDDAAMNEYIQHGETGFLFDADKPKAIEIERFDLLQMQKNAYQSVIEGHRAWKAAIPAAQDFIESSHTAIFSMPLMQALRDDQQHLLEKNNELFMQNQQLALENQRLRVLKTYKPWALMLLFLHKIRRKFHGKAVSS